MPSIGRSDLASLSGKTLLQFAADTIKLGTQRARAPLGPRMLTAHACNVPLIMTFSFSYKLRLWALLWVLTVSGCSEPVAQLKTDRPPSTHRVWVAHDSWHAAMIIRATDIPPETLPETRDFPGAEFFEISWGDAEYFPAPAAGISLAIKAALWSSGSVVHIVGFSGAIAKAYPNAQIIEIALPENGFRQLIGFVDDDLARTDFNKLATASPGLFSHSRFYPAKSNFSALRTCNTWIAEAFRAAGMPLRTAFVITASSLGRQLRPYGTKKD